MRMEPKFPGHPDDWEDAEWAEWVAWKRESLRPTWWTRVMNKGGCLLFHVRGDEGCLEPRHLSDGGVV